MIYAFITNFIRPMVVICAEEVANPQKCKEISGAGHVCDYGFPVTT